MSKLLIKQSKVCIPPSTSKIDNTYPKIIYPYLPGKEVLYNPLYGIYTRDKWERVKSGQLKKFHYKTTRNIWLMGVVRMYDFNGHIVTDAILNDYLFRKIKFPLNHKMELVIDDTIPVVNTLHQYKYRLKWLWNCLDIVHKDALLPKFQPVYNQHQLNQAISYYKEQGIPSLIVRNYERVWRKNSSQYSVINL